MKTTQITSTNRSRGAQFVGRGIGLFLLALAGGASVSCALQGSVSPYKRVAVIDFESTLPGESELRLAETMAVMLSHEIAKHPEVALIDRREIDAAEGKRGLMGFLTGDSESLQSLGKRIDADYLVLGSISRLERSYVLNARLFSVATGDVVPGTAETKSCRRAEDLLPIIQSFARSLSYQASHYDERARLAEEASRTAQPSD